ncbi:HAD family acid phosphatase [Bradyrhizobium genosp. P]|uniref:HAD family acid phosphatase n=1 Tax=Bradyrhizobium genosp. P TaxID=83641 RepID=UPI003CF4DF3E
MRNWIKGIFRNAGRTLLRRSRCAVTVLFAAGALAQSALPGHAAADCPALPQNHVPKVPDEELNIDKIKQLLLDYHQRYYDIDVAAVFDTARAFIEQNATRWNKPALVLDIDETSLTNWPNLLADNFGFIDAGACDALPNGPCGFTQWVMKGSARPIEPALKLFEAAKAKNVAVIFITGRKDSVRDATILNLDHAGFEGWSELRTRPNRDDVDTVEAYKSAERTKVEAKGYTIIANVGDQLSDVRGEPTGKCVFKVPNPFYFIK